MKELPKKYWIFLLVATAVMFMCILYGYIHDFFITTYDEDTKWTPITFTYISNEAALIFLILRVFGKVNVSNKWGRLFQIIVTTQLFITMITYWGLLFDFKDPGSAGDIFATSCVHTINPLLIIFIFFSDTLYKEIKIAKVKYSHVLVFVIIYPLVFFAYQQALWYSIEYPVYKIFDLNKHSYASVLSYQFGLLFAFMLFGTIFNLASNKLSTNIISLK